MPFNPYKLGEILRGHPVIQSPVEEGGYGITPDTHPYEVLRQLQAKRKEDPDLDSLFTSIESKGYTAPLPSDPSTSKALIKTEWLQKNLASTVNRIVSGYVGKPSKVEFIRAMTIRLYELNDETRGWLAVLSEIEVTHVLEMATTIMVEIEHRNGRARLGENGAVELTLRMFCTSTVPSVIAEQV